MNSSGKIMDVVEELETPERLTAYDTGLEATDADITEACQRSMEQAKMAGLPIALLVLIFVFVVLVAAGLVTGLS